MEKESQRQQKVARSIQRDIGDILMNEGKEYAHGAMVSVTRVRVVPDLSYAKVYLSVFPFEKCEEVMKRINGGEWQIRYWLGKKVRNQLRIVPELAFFIDDSMEYVDNIDKLLTESQFKR